MLVSIKCLANYVDLSGITVEEVADKLTFSGVEVEEIIKVASGTNLIIGEVISCEAHPNSDHLHVLNVNLGDVYGVKQIVCGAPNARKGLKVIVAMEGAKLPDGEIKHSVIRGVDSCGMCCSLRELGVNNKYLTEYQINGIEELPLDAPVGNEDVLGYLGLDDVTLNLKVLANRPDLLSIFNVAREVGALLNRKVDIPTFTPVVNFNTNVKVNSLTDKCNQFAIKELRNIKIKPSPKWLSSYLMSMGVRSINNIVDIGNFVMLLTGQPLHMYDEDKLPSKELTVKDNYSGQFIALDEKTYEVIPGDIVITSNDKPMCLGGVMGSKECAVDDNTKNIYIEAASFNGTTIRHTSSRLGLASESSSRFVKGTNHFQYSEVLNFAAKLVMELCDADKSSDIVSYLKESYEEKTITTSVIYINKRLGTHFSFDQISDVLSRLNFLVRSSDDENLSVIVPQFRLDVDGEADLSEEVIRVLGFENVEVKLPTFDVTLGALSDKQNKELVLRNYLLSQGLDECLTYSLLKKNEVDKFNFLGNEEKYVVLNPLTDEHEVFRSHILYSLLKTAEYNVSRQNKDLSLFELSNVYDKKSEHTHIAIVLVGNDLRQGLLNVTPYSFYHMKGLVEGMFASLGIDKSRFKFVKCSDPKNELHPGKSADIIFQNTLIGRFGEIHPSVYNMFNLGKSPVIILEIDLASLFTAKVSLIKMSPISKFPVVTHDLALVVDKSINSDEIIRTIKMSGKGIVNDANVFDVYEGASLGENKKSLAIKISYLSFEHTLSDKEVNEAEEKIKFELFKSYHAELRS